MLAMREVRRFENQQLGRIRAVKDGERWLFCGYDVIKALGYSTSGASAVVNRLCNDIMRFPDLVSHKQLPLNFVSEEDVHRILQCSRSPKINAFEVWFESEILPSLYGHNSLVLIEIVCSSFANFLRADFIVDTNSFMSVLLRRIAKIIARA